jgi:hypothetical protein
VADDRAVSLIFVLVAPKRRTVVVVVVVILLRATVDVDVAFVPLGNLSPGPRGEREKPDEEYHETSGTSSG